MKAEDKYAIALGVLCVVLLVVGTIAARSMSRMNPRALRIVWPVVAMGTAAVFAVFVFIARTNAR